MKQLTCEMCGSIDLVKQGGYFVCQFCGCKYSPEEAKRMMIEGTVEVQGTVSIDNSEFVKKCLLNARRAKEKEDWEEVEKYYNLVEQNDPTNIEAIFYSAFGKVKLALIDCDMHKREAAFTVLKNCISIIDESYNVNGNYNEQLHIVTQISEDLLKLFHGSYVYNRSMYYGIETWNDKEGTIKLFCSISYTFFVSLLQISDKYVYDSKRIPYLKIALTMAEYMLQHIESKERKNLIEFMIEIHQGIKALDSNHEIPSYRELNKIKKAEDGNNGCYVATCVYGSYDCPEVWTLRRYRDNTLGASWYGRLFIRTYYAISPTLVKWFGTTKWFKNLWKGPLNKIVQKLRSQGVENTPYEDKSW